MKIQEHSFWKSVNAKDLYQQPAKHLKVFLKIQLVTASQMWRACVFATNQWELSKLRKATCWDWCQVGANQCGQRWSIMAASIGLTTHSQWRMDRYWTCNWVLNIPRNGMSILSNVLNAYHSDSFRFWNATCDLCFICKSLWWTCNRISQSIRQRVAATVNRRR